MAAPKRVYIDCSDCGRRIAANRLGICVNCRHERTLVELTCIICGKRFQRRQKDHNDFLRRVTIGKRQGPQCSKSCLAGESRLCSWCGADVGRRPPSRLADYAYCGTPRRCDREAMKLVQPMNWPLLTPTVLPMREHVREIVELLGPENITSARSTSRKLFASPTPCATPGATETSRHA